MQFEANRSSRFYDLLVRGRLRHIAAPIYDLVIALELTLQRALDTVTPHRSTEDVALLGELTVVIKTFERPHILDRLLKSIKRIYPHLHIVVVDDSKHPVQIDGVETVIMPYDSGVSAGRREGLRRVDTRYMLLLDDDFVFHRHTRLDEALDLMERHPEIDIMGGAVVNLPFFNSSDYREAVLFPTATAPTIPLGTLLGGLSVCNKVANFFIGRTDRLRLVDWDPILKRIEHADFFNRAMGILTTVFNPKLRCLHAQTPFDQAYMTKREDQLLDAAILQYKYRDPSNQAD